MLKIRLRRMGKRHSPFYRVVVSDSRRTPTASAVDEVGHYDPQPTPPRLALDLERLRYWQEKGAQTSPTVLRLMRRAESGVVEAPVAEEAKPKRSKKAAAAAAEATPAAAEAAPAEAAPVEVAPQAAEEAPQAVAETIAAEAEAVPDASAAEEPAAEEPATDEGGEKA